MSGLGGGGWLAALLRAGLGGVLVAGVIADALARPDRDVEAAVAAHARGDYDEALARLDAAVARLGERPELHLDRGLVLFAKDDLAGARAAFERATEGGDAAIRASAHFELGNLEFDAEAWDAAIERYIEALKARPDHADAKWNLEIALRRREEADKQEDPKDQDESGDGEPNPDEPPPDEPDTDGEPPPEETDGTSTGDSDTSTSTGDGDASTSTGDSDASTSDASTTGDPADAGGSSTTNDSSSGADSSSGGESSSSGSSSGAPDEPTPADDARDSSGEGEGQPAPPAQAPQPIDRADIDRALENLDEQDAFELGRPMRRRAKVPKDW